MPELIFENITKLETPVGYFSITDGEKMIPFSVGKNIFDCLYDVTDKDNNVIGVIKSPETNYEILLFADALEIGKKYTVSFSAGKWKYSGSDELSVGFTTVIDNWVVGVGVWDPNMHEKDMHVEKINFTNYTAEPLWDGTGRFEFEVLDDTCKCVSFSAAWIEVTDYEAAEYKSAVDFWVT